MLNSRLEKYKKFELRKHMRKVVAAERINVSLHLWYKNDESVKIDF